MLPPHYTLFSISAKSSLLSLTTLNMHRQSLGSPSPKLPINEEATSPIINDEDNDKSLKLPKPSLKPERFLHVIPLLTTLCFLILYLSSHDPTQRDLAEFSGFNWPSHTEDTNEMGRLDVERFIEVDRNDILGIRRLKNLQHERETPGSEYRPHRKIAGF